MIIADNNAMTPQRIENILIVDDDHLICWGLEKILSRQNCRVTSVNNGADALSQISSLPYGSVFLDINLPDASGLDMIREIKELSPDTKVVIVTGNDTEHNRKKALAEGAFHFIAKPFDISEIKETVDRIFNGHQAPAPAEPEPGYFLPQRHGDTEKE
jgi:DNA-binding NtrC family response regulator